MADMNQVVEQRKHQRYRVKDRSFAVLGPDAVRLCHLIDISKGGLSYRYFADSNELSGESSELDILCGEEFYLEKVPTLVVSDVMLDAESPFGSLDMRRRGIQFGELTAKQIEQVDYFIEQNTYE